MKTMASQLLGPFVKLSGSGNTFAVVDARPESKWRICEENHQLSRREVVKLICSPKVGIAVDGLLFLETGSQGFDYDWDFYNSDGSSAEMCGNAARCAAYFCYAYFKVEAEREIKFRTGAGCVIAKFVNLDEVEVKMPPAVVTDLKKNIYTTTLGAQSFMNINTGVPHFVQEHPKGFKYLQLKEMANEVRNHKEVQPAGTNVTFFAVEGPGKVQAVTYERGVEDFTSACGTGAVAAALSYSLGNSKIKSVEVEMPGGVLKVSFELGFDCPQLIGEVTFIGEFQVNLEVLKCKD